MTRVFAILVLLAAGLADAGAAGSLGRPGYGGSGCPAGSASVALRGDTVTVRFSSLTAAAGRGRSFDRKACSLSLPIHVPVGQRLSIVGAEHRGRAVLPARAKGTVRAELFLAGAKGPIASRSVSGPFSGPISLSSAARLRSACGRDVILRVNASVTVTAPAGRPASVSIGGRSAPGATYQLRWQAC